MYRKLCIAVLVLCFVASIAQAGIVDVVKRPQPTIESNLQVGSLAYFDRTAVTNPPGGHQYVQIPTWLLGVDYVRVGNDDKSNKLYQLDVTVDEACTLFLLIDNRIGDGNKDNGPTLTTYMPWVAALGFVDMDPAGQPSTNRTYDIGIDESGNNVPFGSADNWFSIFSKQVLPGTTTFGTAWWGPAGSNRPQDNNMYTVAIPEPATIALLGFGALSLLRRRK